MSPKTKVSFAIEDYFDELELDSSWSDSSISDQESSDLVNGPQHSDAQQSTGTSTITAMTSSTEPRLNFAKQWQAMAEQSKSIEFELAWETRDEIISTINQHTKVLSGQVIRPEDREAMRVTNGDLVAELMCLPRIVEERLSGFGSLCGRPEDGLNEVVLDLNEETRSRIIDTLLSNHRIVLESECSSNECKSKQIDKNNKLITELLKLTTMVLQIRPIHRSSYGLDASPQQSMPRQQPPLPLPMQPVGQLPKANFNRPLNAAPINSGQTTSKADAANKPNGKLFRFES